MTSAFKLALVYGLAQSLTFFIYCIGYRFGAFLVIENRTTYDKVFRWGRRKAFVCTLLLQVLALASLAQVLVRVQLTHSVQIEMKSVTSM